MIDVTFLLLVFFIVTLSFRVLEGRLDTALPRVGTVGDAAEEVEKLDVQIWVAEPGTLGKDADGHHAWLDRELRYTVGANRFTTVDETIAFVSAWPDRAVPVSIDARGGTVYGDVMPVLDQLLAAGFDDVRFAGTFEQDW